MKKLPYLLSIAFLTLSFTACSDDGGSTEEQSETTGDGDGDGDGDATETDSGDGDGDPMPGECEEMTLEGWMANENGGVGVADGMIGDPMLPDPTRIEFYTDLAVGPIDLGSPDENNYQVCLHCFRTFQDTMGMDLDGQYFQSAGILDITEVGEGPGQLAATYTGVTLIEVTIDGMTFESTPVVNGRCIDIVDGEINTLP